MVTSYNIFFLLTLYVILIIAFSILIIGNTCVKAYRKQKKVEFTHKVLNERKKEIEADEKNYDITAINFMNMDSEKDYNLMEDKKIFRIVNSLNYFNSLIDGINKNLFDEDLIRVFCKNEMKNVVKAYRYVVRKEMLLEEYDELLLPIEFLLMKWEKDDRKSKRTLKGRW